MTPPLLRAILVRYGLIAAVTLTVLLLASCAAGPNPQTGVAAEGGGVAGFWMGIWHGVISPIALIVSIFSDHVRVYEVHNSGGWYDFGFLLGISVCCGGGAHHSGRLAGRRRKI